MKQGRRVAAYMLLTIMYVVCICTIKKENQAEVVLAFSSVAYMICGLVIPFLISVFYFKRILERPLIGYYVAPFCGLFLSLVLATPFLIYMHFRSDQILFQGRSNLSGDLILSTLIFTVFTLNFCFLLEARQTVNQLLNERIQNIVGQFSRSLQE